jgi:hypothetical protein
VSRRPFATPFTRDAIAAARLEWPEGAVVGRAPGSRSGAQEEHLRALATRIAGG